MCAGSGVGTPRSRPGLDEMRSGSTASSIDASASASSVRSRATSHAVRLERTSLRTRSPSSVNSMPTRRPSPPAPAVRRTRPARTSRATCLDMAAGDTPSLAASSLTPTPGVLRIETSSVTWPPVTPSGCTSRRSSRASWRRTGRSVFATARGSAETVVAGNSLTRLTKPSPPPAVGYPACAKSWQPSRDGRRASRSSEPGRWQRISPCLSSSLIPTAHRLLQRGSRGDPRRHVRGCRRGVERAVGGRLLARARGRLADPDARATRGSGAARAPPHHLDLFYTGIDGIRRKVALTAFPLVGREGELFGAFTIFWHI